MSADLLEKANTNLDDLKENEQVIADKLADLITKEVQDLNSILVSLVDELKTGATDDGKHVLSCIDEQQSNVDNVIQTTIQIISDNLLSEVPLITDLLEVVLRHAGELQDDVKLQTDSLETCDSEDSVCFNAFAESAGKIAQQVASNIQEDYDAAVSVAESILSDIAAWNIRGIVDENTQVIFNDVVRCIYIE